MTRSLHDAADDEALLALLAAAPGAPPRGVSALVRESLADRTAFSIEALTVTLPGREQRLLRKDFARSQLPAAGRRRRACREIAVYRDLLPGKALGTAAYHGSIWDEEHGRFWLVLEYVPGQRLELFDHWLLAAAWLGRLQRAFAGSSAPASLEQHDARFFRATAEIAHKQVLRCVPSAAPRLRAVVDSLAPVVELWAAQPRTLVHGSYRQQNILVDANAAPPRICPIDWEHAAWGAPLYDLAFLTAGLGTTKTTRLLDAYRTAAASNGVDTPPAAEALAIVRSFQLFKLLRSLTRARRWGYAEATVIQLVTLAEEARRGLAI
ncbi:MAG TPA: aminoglycoside phosphotransferase family protein [Planctomycetota bacterium]